MRHIATMDRFNPVFKLISTSNNVYLNDILEINKIKKRIVLLKLQDTYL